MASKFNTNPHCYINPLLELLAKTKEFWPHKARIDKLGILLDRFLGSVSLELKLGFIQNKNNAK